MWRVYIFGRRERKERRKEGRNAQLRSEAALETAAAKDRTERFFEAADRPKKRRFEWKMLKRRQRVLLVVSSVTCENRGGCEHCGLSHGITRERGDISDVYSSYNDVHDVHSLLKHMASMLRM